MNSRLFFVSLGAAVAFGSAATAALAAPTHAFDGVRSPGATLLQTVRDDDGYRGHSWSHRDRWDDDDRGHSRWWWHRRHHQRDHDHDDRGREHRDHDDRDWRRDR